MNQQALPFDTKPTPRLLSTAPHFGNQTSAAAAEMIQPHAGRLRERVYDFIRGRREHGATDQECQDGLNMPPQTQGPRRIELAQAGLVVNSGRTRPTRSGRQAVVWVATGKPFAGKGCERDAVAAGSELFAGNHRFDLEVGAECGNTCFQRD